MKQEFNAVNTSLREIMEREGFRFPCGGKGLCGRCKVIAPSFAPTERDKRFLSAEEIASGIRLACDKTLNGSAVIEPMFEREDNRAERLPYADAYAVFTDYGTFAGLAADGEIKDSVTLPPAEREHYALLGAAQREIVELIERHSVAKASVMLLAADARRFHALTGIQEAIPEGDSVEASLFNMPAEEVYLPPVKGGFTGGDLPLELMGRGAGEMVVCGSNIAYISEASVHAAYIALTAESELVYKAAVEYFLRRFTPAKRTLIGENRIISERGGFRPEPSKIPENAAQALNSNRTKAALRRIAAKIETEDLINDDLFQEILSLQK